MTTIEKEQFIVGTAGHIDHGKTTLVKALTGIDADTLPDEKRRGITIELGFVFMEDPGNERQVMFIDVPGHEKLVRTMVAGASNIDAVMLVIAADEGISMQTIEHFDVVRLLDITGGIIVLTKKDLVDDEWLEAITGDVKEFVKGTFLENAPIIPVSSKTGEGIPVLQEALRELSRHKHERRDSGVFRMPIDRVFTMQGFGTVIAGTVLSGTVRAGDVVSIYPEGFNATVRGMQVHHHGSTVSRTGMRTALNLRDVKKSALRRGQCAAAPGSLTPSWRIDARVNVLHSYPREIKNRARVRLHIGTAEHICRMVLLEETVLKPGESALVQFVLESPAVALPKDRFVIRAFSPIATIGGGILLDPAAEKHSRADDEVTTQLKMTEESVNAALEQIVLKAGMKPLALDELIRLSGEEESLVREAADEMAGQGMITIIKTGTEPLILHTTSWVELIDLMTGIVTEYLGRNPYRHFMPLPELRSRMIGMTDKRIFELLISDAVAGKRLHRRQGKITLHEYTRQWNTQEAAAAERIVAAMQRYGFATPLEDDVCKEEKLQPKLCKNLMDYLVDREVLVRLSDKVTYHADTIEAAEKIVREYISTNGAMSVADLRDVTGVSRKYTLAIMEYFDTIGITRREGDVRVLVRAETSNAS